MKKLFLLIIISLAWTALSAQVQLEKSYNYSGTLIEIADNEYKYLVMDVPLKQCRIYNEDHSIYKTINLDIPGSYYLYDIKFVTKHLFNTDDHIELLYVYNKYTTTEYSSYYQYGLKVVNELGTELLNLNDGGYAEIKQGSDGMKLLTYQYVYYDYYYMVYTNVYNLGGSTKSALAEAEPIFNIYPNPTSDMVTLTMNPWEQINKGQVVITDMSGRTINKVPIETGSNLTRIETDWMSPGTYVMSILSREKIIASEKFEIK